MKKFTIFLCSLVMLIGMSGVAAAAPYTWVDTIDFNPDVYIGSWDSFSYQHDITDQGFDGILQGDYVESYSLTVSLYDDGGRRDWGELAYINQPGLIGDGFFDFSYTSAEYGWSIAGLLQLNFLGTLDVTINSIYGDFYLDQSTLVADGATAPVPEPATMLLLGTGLLGLVAFGRKRFKK